MCTPLRWKEEWLKRPIIRGFDGSAVSEEKPLPYHKLNDDMERQTLDAGFEKALGPKAFRRGAANAANGMSPAYCHYPFFPSQHCPLQATRPTLCVTR